MNKFAVFFFTLTTFCLTLSAAFADIPGSKDPTGIKRYEGSEIIRYEKIQFERYIVPLGKMLKYDFNSKQGNFEKSEPLEGGITRVSYRVPDPLRSSLEVFRNYQNELTSNGWEILWSASGKGEFGNSFTYIYQSLRDNDQLFTYSEDQAHFLSARKASEGLTLTLFVSKYQYGLRRGVKVEKDEPIVQLDLIQTKPMETKMVLLTSSEMAKSIDNSGRVSLYGIYFDFNKDELKPESDPTLEQVSALLRERANLKLLVVGHTDSVGDFDANRELSERRAAAVIGALTQKYGIANTRLRAFGASYSSPVANNASDEGRAKNRRVELVDAGA